MLYSSTTLLSLNIKKIIVDKHTPTKLTGWERTKHKKSGKWMRTIFLWPHFHIIVRRNGGKNMIITSTPVNGLFDGQILPVLAFRKCRNISRI